jgi:hypothetical protein
MTTLQRRQVETKKDVETKKATEIERIVKNKKTSESSPKKVPEWKNVESPAKRTPDILQREKQIEVSSTSQPSAPAPRTLMDKPEMQSLRKTPTTFSIEGELAKLKIPIPLSETDEQEHLQVASD